MDYTPALVQKLSPQIEVILNEIQKKIFGNRNDQLTPLEINTLFQSPINPEFNLVIYRALQRKAIDPDITILQAIPKSKSKEYLISVALCLRFGADSNMYVDDPNLGIIHILGYVYNFLYDTDENILNTIILMLVIKGSRSSMPMFDNNAGKIRDDTHDNTNKLTVLEWLHNQGYKTILDRIHIGEVSELRRTVDTETLAILSILLDMPAIMDRNYESKDLVLAIRAFSSVSFDNIPVPTSYIMMDYKSLYESVVYINADAYEKLINLGQLPSYLLINKILTTMKSYKTNGRIIAMQELERMLLASIAVGVQLDQDQLNIISTLGQTTLDAVMKEYEVPYWRKICKSSHKVAPQPLRNLAMSLNIDPDMGHDAICDNISRLSKADKEALKEAARKRQQLRMASNLGMVNEFQNENIPVLVCRNKSLLQHDPNDYNDIDSIAYRDDQGAIWCFTSDSFASLLESGINPYNSTMLPQLFKDQLEYQISVLKKLGKTPSPTTFSSSIDNLSVNDSITEKSGTNAIDTLVYLASRNNVNIDIVRGLSKEAMMAALNTIGYNINLISLSTNHALITTARILEYVNHTDPESVKYFFNSIRSTV